MPAKNEIQRVFCIHRDETKIFKKSTIRKVLRTLILHINNSKKLLKIFFKMFNKKTGDVTFLAKIDLLIFLECILIFSDFFLIFENPVYRQIFESYLRIGYPDCVIFLRKHIQIS